MQNNFWRNLFQKVSIIYLFFLLKNVGISKSPLLISCVVVVVEVVDDSEEGVYAGCNQPKPKDGGAEQAAEIGR